MKSCRNTRLIKGFSADDLSALLMGLSSLSGMIRGDELVHALAKVRSFIPADRAKEIELKVSQICIDLRPWTGNSNIQPYLEIIKSALQENRLLDFEYIAHHGNKTARTVEPYQLVLKGNHWYLQGYCRKRNDFRLFRLSRMSNLKMKEGIFVPRDYQNRSWILMIFGQLCKQELKSVFINLSWTECLIFALMKIFRQTGTSITWLIFLCRERLLLRYSF